VSDDDAKNQEGRGQLPSPFHADLLFPSLSPPTLSSFTETFLVASHMLFNSTSKPIPVAESSCDIADEGSIDPFESFVSSTLLRHQLTTEPLEEDTIQVHFSQDYDGGPLYQHDSEDDDQSSLGSMSRTTSDNVYLAPPSLSSAPPATRRTNNESATGLSRSDEGPSHQHHLQQDSSSSEKSLQQERGRSSMNSKQTSTPSSLSSQTPPSSHPPPSSSAAFLPSKPLRSGSHPVNASSTSSEPARFRSPSLPLSISTLPPSSSSSSRHQLRIVSNPRRSSEGPPRTPHTDSTPPTSPNHLFSSTSYLQPFSSPNKRHLPPKSNCHSLQPLSAPIRESSHILSLSTCLKLTFMLFSQSDPQTSGDTPPNPLLTPLSPHPPPSSFAGLLSSTQATQAQTNAQNEKTSCYDASR